MSWQIIKQPNNIYCIYSTVVDHFIEFNLSKDELIEFYKACRGKYMVDYVEGILDKLDNNKKPYHQFTVSFDSAIEYIKSIHGLFEIKLEEYSYLDEKEFRLSCSKKDINENN